MEETNRAACEKYLKDEMDDLLWDDILSDPFVAAREAAYEEEEWWESQSDEAQSERSDLIEGVYSDMDDWDRANEEGWYYDD